MIQVLAKGVGNNYKQDIKWKDIRNMSYNRKNFDLYFAIFINVSIMIYRLFEMSMMIFLWIQNHKQDSDDIDGERHLNHDNKDLLIVYMVSKIMAIILFIMEFPMGFILFHIAMIN